MLLVLLIKILLINKISCLLGPGFSSLVHKRKWEGLFCDLFFLIKIKLNSPAELTCLNV